MFKTHKGVAKRFRLTKKGKLKYMHAGKSHILTKKSSKRKRRMRRKDYVGSFRMEKQIKRLMLH
ncbi:MAG: 50S ribosomal protein L35 [Candidatus Omnitrophica bacterium]|nr:50S ribosomal protein L35 [Candidatus Omnitrophota bacterium]